MTFKECEIRGREIFASLCRVPSAETRDTYNRVDVGVTAGTKTFNVEIKYRDFPSTLYEKDGYILEKKKYDALLEAYKQTGSVPTYVNYFSDGIGFSWDLRKISEPVWVWRLLPKESADGGDNEKIWKQVAYIMGEEGNKFNYAEQ